MQNALTVLLPGITLLLFIVNLFVKGNTVQSCLLFILTLLPLMDVKVTIEAYGGFKTFDIICFYCFIFLFKDFITINLDSRNNFYFLLFILLGAVILLSGLNSEAPDKTYMNLLKTVPIFIFGRFLMTECFKDPTFFNRVIRALKTSYIIALVFLCIQLVLGLKFTWYPSLSPNTNDPVFHIIRYPGVFYDSQAHGQFLALGSFLFLYVEEGSDRRAYIINYAIFALSLAAISIAGSRSAFGGFVIGFLIVFLMTAKQYRVYGLIIAAVAYFAFKAISVQSGVFDRAQNFSEDLSYRQSLWKEAFGIAEKHPVLGIGENNYQSYVMRHNQDQYLEVEDHQLVYFDQPESGYLKILVELGFTGFMVFALYLLVPLFKGFSAYLNGTYDKRVAFFMASLVSWMVAFNTVYSIYDYRLLIMVTCMITLIVTYRTQEEYTEEEDVYYHIQEQEV